MVERAKQQHGICTRSDAGEVASVSQFGGQRAEIPVLRRLGDLLYMSLDRLDDVDLETTFDEPHCIDAGAASHVNDPTGRRRQMSIEEFQRSNELQTRSALDEQTRRLESECVVGSNVWIDHGVSFARRTGWEAVRFEEGVVMIVETNGSANQGSNRWHGRSLTLI